MGTPFKRRRLGAIIASVLGGALALGGAVAPAAQAVDPDPIPGSRPSGVTSVPLTTGKAQGSGLWGWAGDLKTRPYSATSSPYVFTYGVAASPLDGSIWVTDSAKIGYGTLATFFCGSQGGTVVGTTCHIGDSKVLNYKLDDAAFGLGQYTSGGVYAATPTLASGLNAGLGANFQSYADATKIDDLGPTSGEFVGARGIAVGADGKAWINDSDAQIWRSTTGYPVTDDKKVRVLNPDFTEGDSLGAYYSNEGANRNAPDAFGWTTDGTVLANGNHLVTVEAIALLKEYEPDGTFVRNIALDNALNPPAGRGNLGPSAVAHDPTTAANDVLVGYNDPGSGNPMRIERIDLDGCTTVDAGWPAGATRDRCEILATYGVGVLPNGTGNSQTSLASTFAIAVDPHTGDFYVSTRDQNPYAFATDGTYRGRFPSFGMGTGSESNPVQTDGQIRLVRGISFDSNGFLYASTTQGHASTKVVIYARTPQPVTDLAGEYTSAAKTAADLSWTAPVHVAGDGQAPLKDYVIEQQVDGGAWAQIGQTTSTSYSVTGLDPSKTYNYRISAWNEAGNSDVAVTPLNDAPAAPSTMSIVKTGDGVATPTAADAVHVAADSTVDFEYTVTNTAPAGSAPITGIALTDSELGDVTDVVSPAGFSGTLAPGESAVLSASGPVAAGAYVNTATVTGASAGHNLSASDDWYGFGVTTGLNIVKTGNGEVAATSAAAVDVPAGSTVAFAYTVTNTGNVPIAGLVLEDDVLGPIAAPAGFDGTLAANGGTVTFSATGPVAAGPYVNTATATGRAAGGQVQAATEWHGDGVVSAAPGISVVKTGNGVANADQANALRVPAGSAVSFEYLVTNTGNVPVDGLALVDDVLGPIAAPAGFSGTLAPAGEPGDRVTFTASGPVAAGAYVNTATASARYPGQDDLIASDDWYGFGVTTGLSIVKTGNGEVADHVDGAIDVPANGAVDFAYTITNTGNAPVDGLALVDDVLGPIAAPAGFSGTLAPAGEPGDRVTFTASGPVAAGAYVNTATVTGTSGGGAVSAETAWHGNGVPPATDPALSVRKTGNGIANAAAAEALHVPAGSIVTFEYTVANTGDVELTLDRLLDDVLGEIDAPDGFDGTLAAAGNPGDSVVFTATGTVAAGPYRNLATATAHTVAGEEVTAGDDWFGHGDARDTQLPGTTNQPGVQQHPGTAVPSGLASTGGASALLTMLAACGALLGGLALLTRRRSRRA